MKKLVITVPWRGLLGSGMPLHTEYRVFVLPPPDGDRLVNIRKGNFNIFSEKLPSPDGD